MFALVFVHIGKACVVWSLVTFGLSVLVFGRIVDDESQLLFAAF